MLSLTISFFSFGFTQVSQSRTFALTDFRPSLHLREWEADGNGFIFQNPETEGLPWFRVDVNTQQVSISPDYPVSPLLSDEETTYFQTNDVIRVSPNQELLVYVTEGPQAVGLTEGEPRRFYYTFANRATRQVVRSGLRAPDALSLGELLNFSWSTDTTSLAIGTLTEAGRQVVYLSFQDLAHLEDTVSDVFDESSDGREFYTGDPIVNRLFDISDSGEHVLLSAQENNTDLDVLNERTYLILWSPTAPGADQILELPGIDPRLAMIAFAPQSDDMLYVWVFDAFGALSGRLYSYNIMQGTMSLLTTIDQLYSPVFSPSGEWLSYSSPDALVFLRLDDLGAGTPVDGNNE